MFTGLIEGRGEVEAFSRRGPEAVLRVRSSFDLSGLENGDSIAVSGPCLTVTTIAGASFEADVSAETLARTNLGQLHPGAEVNLERPLRLGGRLGGHLVSGHIDGLARLESRERAGESLRLVFSLEPALARYIIPQGSIAVEGVSLTVNRVEGNRFEVNIIPHTAAKTTLGLKKPGEVVNIEADMIGKYVERLVRAFRAEGQELSQEFLARHGFIID